MADVVAAPAKLTRSLRVTGVRADGYHLIDAEMVTLDLADTLTFADGDELGGRGPATCATPAGASRVGPAPAAAGRRACATVGKRTPAGAALRRRSAAGAAVLRWGRGSGRRVARGREADGASGSAWARAWVRGLGEQW